MPILILACLFGGLLGFYISLKKQKPTFLYMSFIICLFSSFLFSFFVDGRSANKINILKNTSYTKFDTLEKSDEEQNLEIKTLNESLLVLQNQISTLQSENSELGQKQREIKAFNAKETNPCKQLPLPLDIGIDQYPIAAKYSTLGQLGEIFTAAPCGQQRIQKIFGVDGENYNIGAGISLPLAPSAALLKTFETLGFTCTITSTEPKDCTEWKLDKTIKMKDLLKLEPFYKEFSTSSCVNC